MAAKAKTRDEDLYRLCDEIAAQEGHVRISHLRNVAGGGSYARLKTIVEAWEERRRRRAPVAAPAEEAASATAEDETGTQDDSAAVATGTTPLGERGLAVENARLEARIGELVRENDRLWEHLSEERTARIREVERLNQLIEALHRQAVADRRAIRDDYSAALARIRPA